MTNEEAEKSFEVTPKELEARFNVGNVSVPALIDRLEKETDAELDKIAELLKNKKIDQLIIHARENREPNLTLMQDPDTQLAIYMLQNLTKENVFTENAAFSMIPKGGSAENLKDFNETKFQGGPVPMEKETSKKGLKMFLDVGGTWPEIDKDGNIHVDHHGEGQRKPTSSAEMVYKILKKADLLKENPPWLPKYIELLNSIENLTYLNKKENGKRVFDEEYLKQVYPNSLYSLMDDDNVFSNQILELCANGTIKDPTKPFTKEELDGELGKTPIKKKVREKVPGKNQEEETRIVIKEFTIKELCAAAFPQCLTGRGNPTQ